MPGLDLRSMKNPARRSGPVHFETEDPEQPGAVLAIDLLPLGTTAQLRIEDELPELLETYTGENAVPIALAYDGTVPDVSLSSLRICRQIERMIVQANFPHEIGDLHLLMEMMPNAFLDLQTKCVELNNRTAEKKGSPAPGQSPASVSELSSGTPHISSETTDTSGLSPES